MARGGIAGFFLHERHHADQLHGFRGWWGNKHENKFEMRDTIDLAPGAAGFQLSNPSVLDIASVLGSLEHFEPGMETLRQRGQLLACYFLAALGEPRGLGRGMDIVTPLSEKGCQFSLRWPRFAEAKAASESLEAKGCVTDLRHDGDGGVVRVALVPLYNSFEDVRRLVQALN